MSETPELNLPEIIVIHDRELQHLEKGYPNGEIGLFEGEKLFMGGTNMVVYPRECIEHFPNRKDQVPYILKSKYDTEIENLKYTISQHEFAYGLLEHNTKTEITELKKEIERLKSNSH